MHRLAWSLFLWFIAPWYPWLQTVIVELQALLGEVGMSTELDDIARALLNGQIASLWRRLAPDTLKSLGGWMVHFQRRLNQYTAWVRYTQHTMSVFCFPLLFTFTLQSSTTRVIEYSIVSAEYLELHPSSHCWGHSVSNTILMMNIHSSRSAFACISYNSPSWWPCHANKSLGCVMSLDVFVKGCFPWRVPVGCGQS